MPSFELHLGDCAEVMRTLDDGSVTHVITDPPYEAEAHTMGRRLKQGSKASSSGEDDRAIEEVPLDFDPISQELRSLCAAEFRRLATRWTLVFCQIEAAMKWRDELVAAGAAYKRSCIWVKPDGMPQLTGDRPGMGYETIVTAHRPGRSKWNGGGRTGVFTFNKGGDPRTGHMTQKPLALMERLILDFTDRGDLVLDPFCGSGSTGVACLRHGRRFIGIERDPKYFEIAKRRLEATKEQATFEFSKPGKQEALIR